MPVTVNINVHQTASLLTTPVASGDTLTCQLTNNGYQESYFTLETIRNSSGFYDSASPKNTSGSFTLGTGIYGLIQNDQIASVIVSPGTRTLTFAPAVTIAANTLFLRGTGYK